MPGLEVAIIRVVMAVVPEIIKAVRGGDTDAAVLAKAKRLAIELAYERAARMRNAQ